MKDINDYPEKDGVRIETSKVVIYGYMIEKERNKLIDYYNENKLQSSIIKLDTNIYAPVWNHLTFEDVLDRLKVINDWRLHLRKSIY